MAQSGLVRVFVGLVVGRCGSSGVDQSQRPG